MSLISGFSHYLLINNVQSPKMCNILRYRPNCLVQSPVWCSSTLQTASRFDSIRSTSVPISHATMRCYD
ncbi:hypothetical protein T05_3505 [Trichinella murrelli]|uniref:Uncharacterized protein n=1 Tax=Trichinella murrelli TaxID=144512 RepID=A0A0V0TJ69_9BILA|nr:hypothetical protein T05_5144 [Trichinella murrelli]KRX39087.1 hypothetical protein T05_3505 [Trichinella murrelli]